MCRVGLKVIFSFSVLIIMSLPPVNGKLLKCPQADMLNVAFQGLPYALARLKISHRAVSTTKAILASEMANAPKTSPTDTANKEAEMALVKRQLGKIFEPIKEFLSEIRRCSFFISPLLEKSLPEKIIKKSYLIKFMHSSSGLMEFFNHEITNREKFDEVCEEMGTFLTDIDDSLTPETQKAYSKFIQEVKQSQKITRHEDKMILKSISFDGIHLHDHDDQEIMDKALAPNG